MWFMAGFSRYQPGLGKFAGGRRKVRPRFKFHVQRFDGFVIILIILFSFYFRFIHLCFFIKLCSAAVRACVFYFSLKFRTNYSILWQEKGGKEGDAGGGNSKQACCVGKNWSMFFF